MSLLFLFVFLMAWTMLYKRKHPWSIKWPGHWWLVKKRNPSYCVNSNHSKMSVWSRYPSTSLSRSVSKNLKGKEHKLIGMYNQIIIYGYVGGNTADRWHIYVFQNVFILHESSVLLLMVWKKFCTLVLLFGIQTFAI